VQLVERSNWKFRCGYVVRPEVSWHLVNWMVRLVRLRDPNPGAYTFQRQFLKRKRTSIESAIERSMIRLDDHQICKKKSSENCRGCKEIGLTVRPRKQHVLDVITPNSGGSKRRKRSIFDCDICDIPLCRNGPCRAAYHNSI